MDYCCVCKKYVNVNIQQTYTESSSSIAEGDAVIIERYSCEECGATTSSEIKSNFGKRN